MRRLTKEELVNFDNTSLFPERRAFTVWYKLSEPEMALYDEVTDYVRNEMNRVERSAENDGKSPIRSIYIKKFQPPCFPQIRYTYYVLLD